MAENVGYVTVRVRPDAKGFRREAARQIDDETRGLDAGVKIHADTSGLRGEVSRGLNDAVRGQEEIVPVRVRVDQTSARKAASDLKRLNDSLAKALATPGTEHIIEAANSLEDITRSAKGATRELDVLTEKFKKTGEEAKAASKNVEAQSEKNAADVLRVTTAALEAEQEAIDKANQARKNALAQVTKAMKKAAAEEKSLAEGKADALLAVETELNEALAKAVAERDRLFRVASLTEANAQQKYDLSPKNTDLQKNNASTSLANSMAKAEAMLAKARKDHAKAVADAETKAGEARLKVEENLTKAIAKREEASAKYDAQRLARQKIYNDAVYRAKNKTEGLIQAVEDKGQVALEKLLDKQAKAEQKSAEASEAYTKRIERDKAERKAIIKAALTDREKWITDDEHLNGQLQEVYDEAFLIARTQTERIRAIEAERALLKRQVISAKKRLADEELADELKRIAYAREILNEQIKQAREALATEVEFHNYTSKQRDKLVAEERRRLAEQMELARERVETERRYVNELKAVHDREMFSLEKIAELRAKASEYLGSPSKAKKILLDYEISVSGLDEDALASLKEQLDEMEDFVKRENAKIDLSLEIEPSINERRYREAAERLGYIARDREVNLLVKYRESGKETAIQSVRSMVGGNLFQETTEKMEDILRNLDEYAIAWGRTATKVGAAVGVLSGASATVFSLYGNLAKVVGLANLAPAAFVGLAATFIANKAAWEDFSGAVNGDDSALSRLPERAKESALAMRGFYDEIRRPAQETFWDEFGDDFDEMILTLRGELPEGIRGVTMELAGLEAGFARAVTEGAASGRLADELQNVANMVGNAAEGAESFGQTLDVLAFNGAKYLPQFGSWLTEISNGFRDWAVEAERTGALHGYIQDGVTALKELADLLGDTVGLMNDFAEVAEKAGAPDMSDLINGLEVVRSKLQDDVFQTRLAKIFDGGLEGIAEMSQGIAQMGKALGENAETVAEFERTTGRVVSNVAEIGAEFIRTRGFMDGMLNLVKGIQSFTESTAPGWRAIADAVGDTGTMLGSMVSDSAPGFVNASKIISRIWSTLMEDLTELSPTVGRIAGMFTEMADGPLSLMLDIVDALIDGFNLLPAPVQDTIAAIGLAIAAKRQFGVIAGQAAAAEEAARRRNEQAARQSIATEERRMAVINQVTGAVTRQGAATRAALGEQVAPAQRASNGVREIGVQAQQVAAKATAMGAAMSTALGRIGADARLAAAEVRAVSGSGVVAGVAGTAGAVRGLGAEAGNAAKGGVGLLAKGASGLMGLLGGPLGLVLAGTALVVGEFSEKNQEAEQRANEFKNSLSELGQVTEQTGKVIRDQLQNQDDLFFFKGPSVDEKRKTLEKFGMSFEEVADQVKSGSTVSSDALRGLIAEQDKIIEQGTRVTTAGAMMSEYGHNAGVTFTESAEKAKVLRASLEDMRVDVEKAEQAVAEATKAHIKASLATQEHSQNGSVLTETFKSMTDAATSTRDRVSLVGEALSVLDTATVKSQASDLQRVETLRDMTKGFAQVAEGAQGTVAPLLAADGKIKSLEGSGGQLYTSLTGWNEKLREQAAIVYDASIAAGKTPEQAANDAAAVFKVVDNNMGALADTLGLTGVEFGKLRAQYIDQPWEVKASLGADAAQFNIAVDAARKKGHELTETEWTAFIKGNEDQFNAAYQAVKNKGLDWSASFYEAYLAANPDPASRSVEGAKEFALAFANGNYEAVLDALPEKAKLKIDELYAKGSKWSDEKWEATLSALDESDPVVAAYIRAMRDATGKTYSATMKAMVEGMGDVEGAKRLLAEFPELTETQLKALDGVTPEAVKAVAALRGIEPEKVVELLMNNKNPGVAAEVKAQLDSITPEKIIDILTQDLNPQQRRQVVEELKDLPPEKLTAMLQSDLSPDVRRAVLAELAKAGETKTATLAANDVGLGTRAGAQNQIDMYGASAPNPTLRATDAAYPTIQTAKNAAHLFATSPYVAVLGADNKTPVPAAQATAILNGVRDGKYVASIEASNNAGDGTSRARLTIRNLTDGKHVATIEASDQTGGGTGNARASLAGVTEKQWLAWITSEYAGLPAPPALPDLYQRIVLGYAGSAGNAPIYDDGSATHANGGLYDSVGLGRTVRRYATGGIEDHTATISYSSPTTPVRIWAEPETGGEAYIPLSATKRTRSTAILNTVASKFGYDLVRKGRAFADGGTVGLPTLAAKSGPTFNMTINNPVGEPTERTLQRSLAYMAAPGI